MKLTLFTEELRKCLNAAGLSDCGENDSLNYWYWYQRVLKAHNDAVERQIATEQSENAKLRELVRGLHMAYVGALNKCEGMDEGLIWEHCEMVDAELAKSHARFEADRHRFDVAMSELGIEVDE